MTDEVIDPAKFQLGEVRPVHTVQVQRVVKQKNRFIKGPIPLAWMHVAWCLPGRALHVGMQLWYRVGFHPSPAGRTPTTFAPVKVNLQRIAANMGVDRATVSRGLRALERAGLVRVRRRPGCNPRVTIVLPAPRGSAPFPAGRNAPATHAA